MSNKIKIGKIVATHGIVGEVILVHSLGKKINKKDVEHLFIEQTKNSYIPYYISSLKNKTSEECLIHFDDFKTKEAAKLIVGKPAWAAEEVFDMLASKKSAIALLGFLVFDNTTALSQVIEVIEQPHQILLTIKLEDNEAYLPMHEASIIKIDYKQKHIYLNLPDGLLDLYR